MPRQWLHATCVNHAPKMMDTVHPPLALTVSKYININTAKHKERPTPDLVAERKPSAFPADRWIRHPSLSGPTPMHGSPVLVFVPACTRVVDSSRNSALPARTLGPRCLCAEVVLVDEGREELGQSRSSLWQQRAKKRAAAGSCLRGGGGGQHTKRTNSSELFPKPQHTRSIPATQQSSAPSSKSTEQPPTLAVHLHKEHGYTLFWFFASVFRMCLLGKIR